MKILTVVTVRCIWSTGIIHQVHLFYAAAAEAPMLIMPQPSSPEVEDELRSLQYTAEERDRLFPPKDPFDLDAWLRSGPPATPEELEEMEELLRLREADREASIARDLGLAP